MKEDLTSIRGALRPIPKAEKTCENIRLRASKSCLKCTQLQLGIEAHDCNLSILERGRKVRKFKDSLGYIMFSRPTRARPSCPPSKKEKEEERELGDMAHRMLATHKAVGWRLSL